MSGDSSPLVLDKSNGYSRGPRLFERVLNCPMLVDRVVNWPEYSLLLPTSVDILCLIDAMLFSLFGGKCL